MSSHIGKTVHRAVCDHQAQVYESYLQRKQVGGRRDFPVTMGVHYIRAAARTARRLKRSHALIFLDLQEAFYRVLRPIAIEGRIAESLLATVASRLQLPADALGDLHELLQLPHATQAAELPRHMQRALQALHTNTHFRMSGQSDVTHTRIGSRPGDPFAGVIFGCMFSRLSAVVEQRMRDLGILEVVEDVDACGLFPPRGSQPEVAHPILGPTWMDDLCSSLTSATASGVERKASLAAGFFLESCMQHGVTPNLSKRKSEILLSFRGPGPRSLKHKHKYFSPPQGRCMPTVTEYGSHRFSVVGEWVARRTILEPHKRR
jgi:hypothetical protein